MTIFNEIERDAKNGTPGDWTGHNMTHEDGRMTPEEIGEYVCNAVKKGDPGKFLFVSGQHDDGGDCDICHTGNGPKGEANTRRIANVPRYERAIMAAKELAEAVTHEREMVCQDMGLQSDATNAVEDALAAFRDATQ